MLELLAILSGLFAGPALMTYLERHMVDDNRRTDAVARVMSADLSAMRRRYAEDAAIDPDAAALHETEFRRFFAVMALHPGVRFGLVSDNVRAFWASASKCEPAYGTFCLHAGGALIGYDPHNVGKVLYGRTWAAYREVFGMEPPAGIWPRPMDRDLSTCGVSLRHPGRKPRPGLVPLLAFARPGVAVFVDVPDDGGFGFEKCIPPGLPETA